MSFLREKREISGTLHATLTLEMKALVPLCAALMTTACGLSFNPDLPADGRESGKGGGDLGVGEEDTGGEVSIPGIDGGQKDPCEQTQLADGGAGGASQEKAESGLGGACSDTK